MILYDNDAHREEFMELVYDLLRDDGTNDRANQIIAAFDSAPEVEAEPLPPNDPLTLEELREMDGDAVWVTPTKESKNWWVPQSLYWRRPKMAAGWRMLVDVEGEKCFESHLASAYFATYGKNWLAYRCKPEEGNP